MESPSKPLISLVMIVKNEADNIRATIASVKSVVDHCTILDTGSTDGTMDVLRVAAADLEIPIKIFEEPFVDFSTTRNRALALEAGREDAAEFTLMLSGEETIGGGEALRAYLEGHRGCDAREVEVRQGSQLYVSARVLPTVSDWQYEGGGYHEKPVNRKAGLDRPAEMIPGCYVEHTSEDAEKKVDATYERGIPEFQKLLDEDPTDKRALLFLGHSYEFVAPYTDPSTSTTLYMTAMSYYRRYVETGGATVDEVAHAKLHYLECARIVGLFKVQEVLERAEELRDEARWHPGVQFLYALALSKVRPKAVEEIYEAARVAIKAAEDFKVGQTNVPIDRTCLWRAYWLAAVAVRSMGGPQDPRVAEYVDKGISAGGDIRAFTRLAQVDAPKVAPEEPPGKFIPPDEVVRLASLRDVEPPTEIPPSPQGEFFTAEQISQFVPKAEAEAQVASGVASGEEDSSGPEAA